MKKLICLLLILAPWGGRSAYAVSPGEVEVLQFEGVAPAGRGSPFLTGYFNEGSYRVYTPYGQWVDKMTDDVGTEHPDNGTDWFLNNNTGGIVIGHSLSNPFYLLQLDLTEYSWVMSGGRAINIDGITPGGATLSTILTTAVRAPYLTPQFQRFVLPTEWTQTPLRSVTITQQNNGFAVDNIYLRAAPLPEPGTFGLAIISCAAVLLGRRRGV